MLAPFIWNGGRGGRVKGTIKSDKGMINKLMMAFPGVVFLLIYQCVHCVIC